jgi:regulator of sigma E protease
VNWALAIGGIILLIVLHEFGHFAAAKLTGMRVERFFLFFPPKLVSVRRGETEYGVGAIPLGGFVKITGMNPEEDLDPEVAPRAYYNQPVWKRVVTILAGPTMNLLIAFLILFAIAFEVERPTEWQVGTIVEGSAAEGKLEVGDRIVSVDGIRAENLSFTGRAERWREAIDSHECAGEPEDGCRATTAARFLVVRDEERTRVDVHPTYDDAEGRNLVGFGFEGTEFVPVDTSVGEAAEGSLDLMWFVTSETVSTFAQIFDPEEREELGSVVGATKVTADAFESETTDALQLVAVVSLSLALINLFPFLPLDGGHVFWSLVEKVRGRRVPFRVMERASVVGFMLVILIFFIGLSNDIERFTNGGFDVPR